MASVQFGVSKINPTIEAVDVVYDATGAALEGANVLQVTYNDASFTGPEGKIRLLLALEMVKSRIERGTWPAS